MGEAGSAGVDGNSNAAEAPEKGKGWEGVKSGVGFDEMIGAGAVASGVLDLEMEVAD